MALICNLPVGYAEPFEFIDCSSVSISYEITGIATISFTVVSTSKDIDLSKYVTVSFGSNAGIRTTGSFSSGEVTYSGIINGYELNPISKTNVYEHKITLLAWGCK